MTKPLNRTELGSLQPIETPDKQNDTWAMNTIVVGSESRNTAAKYIQVIVDHHSRYTWAQATKTNPAEAAVRVLDRTIKESGVPKKLILDNGTNRFKNYAKSQGIQLAYISPYHSQANGLVERTKGTIVRHVIIRVMDKLSIRWSTMLETAIKDYNQLPHSATGQPPAALHYGWNLPFGIDLKSLRQVATEKSRTTQDKRKVDFDAKHESSSFRLKDLVIIRITDHYTLKTKFLLLWDGTYEITAKLGLETYCLTRINSGTKMKNVFPNEVTSHASELRLYRSRAHSNKKLTD